MNKQEIECDCTGCNNIATHTWSGHPTCNACSSTEWKRKLPDTKSKRGIDMKAQVYYSLFVRCPECDYLIDLIDSDDGNHDDEGDLSTPLFNNEWDDIVCDATCKECNHEFKVKGAEY